MELKQANFDKYVERKLKDPGFREEFAAADRAWDIALQLVALRRERGLTQEEVAELLGTKQQAIARLENPAYTGHSLSMIRRYVEALGAAIDVTIVPSSAEARRSGWRSTGRRSAGSRCWRVRRVDNGLVRTRSRAERHLINV